MRHANLTCHSILAILSTFVSLSVNSAKDLVRWAKMLRCTQHDNAGVYELMRIPADSSAPGASSHVRILELMCIILPLHDHPEGMQAKLTIG